MTAADPGPRPDQADDLMARLIDSLKRARRPDPDDHTDKKEG